ncbi:hypothetical protein DFJ58DRAFT_917404 [Suillus subalutaceus]|uniref:uncharacterized protein n=1 Tax=Suillus subalutaceus TaxID=48586 RepID=UPI001B880A33|nr:uncharacterized protein DFJ58DRAFT_917404 [Suillus subalutaceus]KAG1837322.1 hypothetical protein DFJ58DRAFT_917404 [Suillus subalutaceus]
MDQADLSQLRTEFTKLANDLASSRLRGTDLEDLKLPEDSELRLRLKKRDKFMAKAKAFLDSCDRFLQPLSNMSPIAASLYGGLMCIVTIAAAKAEILDEVIYGLNVVLDGLPLIIRSERMTNFSDEERRAIISAFKVFVAFMQILRGYVGEKHESVITKFKRIAGSQNIPGKLRAAREEMRTALNSAHYGTFVAYAEDEQQKYISDRIENVKRVLHCTNYEDHLDLYLNKSRCIENPCAWSKSHPSIVDWLSTETSPKLFISGKPGTGKSVLAAHMIDIAQKKKKDAGHRGALLYYFCGADPAADQYSNAQQEASSKAILMTLLRQIVSACHHSTVGLSEVLKYVLASGQGMLSEPGLRTRVANLLESFDTVSIIIDAVDHCGKRAFQQDGLIPWILNMTARARILLIGCPHPYVTSLLAGLPTIALGSDGTTQSDLEAYAHHVVQIYIGSDDPDEPHLVQNLVRRSENMFQYIFLVKNMSHYPRLYNRERRFQFLNDTPSGIFGMYKYYLAVQLQRFSDSDQTQLERVLEILLQLLTFSPSPVTPLIFLQALQSCPSIQRLELNPETDDLAIGLARNVAGILFDVRVTSTGVQHLVPVHSTLSEYFLVSGGNERYSTGDISLATQEALVSLHNAVRETGPESLLELCCNGLRHQDFNRFIHRYQYAADFCRRSLSDTSTRDVRPNTSRQESDCERLQAQLWRDSAFSICDSLALERSWMDRQWDSLKEDGEWFREHSSIMEDYGSLDEETLAPSLRLEISRWRNVVFPRMKEQLELRQNALSELQTGHLSAYAFRNTIFYLHLHLMNQKTTSHYPSSPSFEGLILHYLDQLENLLPVLVSVQILPFSEYLADSASPTAKLATMICGLEQLTRAIRELLPTRKSYPRQLLGMIYCLWATGSANLGALFTTEEIWARAYYSELIIPGLNADSIPEKLIRHTLERVLLHLADAERICFTSQTQSTGVGNLCFCIRQLRQTISHHLLFQTFHPTSTSIQKGSLVPEFVKREPGFTNIVLLRDAVRVDTLDQDNLQPSAPKTWSIFLGAVFIILGFISSHHTCFIFSLFSAPPDTTHGLMRQTSGWPSVQLVASAGVIGCFCDRERAGTVTIGTIACALGVLLVLISPQSASSPLVTSIDAISTDYLMLLSVVPHLLVSSHEQGFWTAIESTAVLYVVVRLLAFAVDKSGMKRKRRDLARIGRKYKRRNEEQAGPFGVILRSLPHRDMRER